MKAVHFGAGSIGRGFIADLLHDSGYDIVFLDVDDHLINQINHTGTYNLYLINEHFSKKTINQVKAISSLSNEKEAIEEIRTADLITTSVWADNLPKIAPILVKGLKERRKTKAAKINLLACENALFNSEILKREILKIADGFTESDLNEVAAFPNTAVDRLVLEAVRDGERVIDIGSEHELVIERNKLADPGIEPIKGAVYTDNLQKYIERKLYIINCGHAWAGYMGHIYGYTGMQDIFHNEQLVSGVREVMLESSGLLAQKYDFSLEDLKAYIEFAIARFQTPGITDTVNRVARSPIRKLQQNERLTGPCIQCEEYGLQNSRLLQGIAAAFLFNNPADEQSAALQYHIKKYGIAESIPFYTAIPADSRMYAVILEQYGSLKNYH
ncbi:hypothetical protein P22_1278 [Propionispora sp. 2/2-37]|uniref:mannitol-1-phosphate 5-dehydrogenase n=1 Tax=Propionispora sp. 2/2-37 TaxID=1677858 RepID=UPI0006BB8189|nr:mannitol-1-phosphate 5-dehydrogenase [Propionispora sp. 2/2-37]CUH95208.1 hypothetical protein P22_1278 [Propionispora sp. 2/2-37]